MKSNTNVDTKGAAKTGNQPTLVVAIEQNFPQEERIINDTLAPKLYSGADRFWIQLTKISVFRNLIVDLTEKLLPGGWSCFLVRKRYIDEHLLEAVGNREVEAVVNLGAGFDTRLYRFEALRNIPCWEVDQPINIAAKERVLKSALKTVPENVTLTGINFVEQEIGELLKQSGYQAGAKTFFVWEAVSQYLNDAAVKKVFDFFAKAPAGSQLVFTYIPRDFIDGTNLYNQEKFYKRVVLKDKIWQFGFDPTTLGELLGRIGWKLVKDLGYTELSDRYVKPTGRNLGVLQIERVVYAEKVGDA
jgi:methyltransferase (TIGR00027 family)|tara:strand:- start:499 stop:1404 length:906 start_codon:yes stop_codon:yes gene_type:complete